MKALAKMSVSVPLPCVSSEWSDEKIKLRSLEVGFSSPFALVFTPLRSFWCSRPFEYTLLSHSLSEDFSDNDMSVIIFSGLSQFHFKTSSARSFLLPLNTITYTQRQINMRMWNAHLSKCPTILPSSYTLPPSLPISQELIIACPLISKQL